MGTVKGNGEAKPNLELCQNAACGHNASRHLMTSAASEKKFGACHSPGCRCNKFAICSDCS